VCWRANSLASILDAQDRLYVEFLGEKPTKKKNGKNYKDWAVHCEHAAKPTPSGAQPPMDDDIPF